MHIEKKENYTLITVKENSVPNFYDSFLIEEKNFSLENIIIQFSDKIISPKEEFLLFLDVAIDKKEKGTSFIIVNANIDVDDFPEHFNIVPTLQEAEDVIEMENIERELGF